MTGKKLLKTNLNIFKLATWSEWTECLGSCVSTRRRICSKQFGCHGLELEEKKCSNADDLCFQIISDILPKSELFYNIGP